MTLVPIYGVGKAGIVRDVPDYKLPPEAWTNGRNVRFIDGKIKRMEGEAAVMNPPTVAPGFVLAVEGSAGVWNRPFR